MKLLPIRLVAATAFFAFALPAAMTGREQTPDAERDARAFLHSFQEASSRKDRAELERMIAPGFTAVDRAGTTRDRAAWIEAVVSGAMLAQKSDPEEAPDPTSSTTPPEGTCLNPIGLQVSLRAVESPTDKPVTLEIIGVAKQVKQRPDETADSCRCRRRCCRIRWATCT